MLTVSDGVRTTTFDGATLDDTTMIRDILDGPSYPVKLTGSGPVSRPWPYTPEGVIAAAIIHGWTISGDLPLSVLPVPGTADGPNKTGEVLVKHYGPGPHPGTGTPQAIHTGDERVVRDPDFPLKYEVVTDAKMTGLHATGIGNIQGIFKEGFDPKRSTGIFGGGTYASFGQFSGKQLQSELTGRGAGSRSSQIEVDINFKKAIYIDAADWDYNFSEDRLYQVLSDAIKAEGLPVSNQMQGVRGLYPDLVKAGYDGIIYSRGRDPDPDWEWGSQAIALTTESMKPVRVTKLASADKFWVHELKLQESGIPGMLEAITDVWIKKVDLPTRVQVLTWGDLMAILHPADDLVKHYGPGPHPGTGSDQTIHGARLLNPATGKGTLGGKPVFKLLTTADGSPWTYTAEHKGKLFSDTVGKLKDITSRYKEALSAMKGTLKANGLPTTPRALDTRLNRLLDSAVARYKAHPELIAKDRFYELWHESLYELSQETGIDMTRVIAAASAISPGLDAERNLHFAHDLARMVATEDEIEFAGSEAKELSAWLREKGDAILAPRYDKGLHKIPEGFKDGDLRPPPAIDSPRYLQGKALTNAADMIDDRGSFTVADLEAYPAAYVLHSYRKAHGPMGELNGEVRGLYVDPPRIAVTSKLPSGFDIPKGFDNYEKAIEVLRGDLDPLNVLGDVKTRSFHNNILDPLNASGRNDVTVDYHTINFVTGSFGADQNTQLTGTPSFEGVHLGVRPMMADAIRRAAVRYKDQLPDGHVPSRIQEIAWAEWKRGLKSKDKLSWTSFTGKVSDLEYTGKGIWRQAEQ